MSNKVRVELVDGILAEIGPPNSWHARASVHPCQGTKFHSPVPLTTQRFESKALDDTWLCPTCTSKLEIFLHIHDYDPLALTWDVLREFGNQIRILGQKIISHQAA